MIKMNTDVPLSKELDSLSNRVKASINDIDVIDTRVNKLDLSLKETEDLMAMVKDLQMQVSDQNHSFLVSLSKLRKSLSNRIALKRKAKGKGSLKLEEGQKVIFNNVEYIVKNGQMVDSNKDKT
jgi:regulator of replication initiation timing